MANEAHVAILRQGVTVWNAWRQERPEVLPDLANSDLAGANLHAANLRGATIIGVKLIGAILQGATFTRADLRGANLRDADLRDANFQGARLQDADLRDADLRDANLQGADLQGADLQGADLQGATLSMANLSMTKLTVTKLRRANLFRADLLRANLQGADLQGATLRWANLTQAILTGVNLSVADLHQTVLSKASLAGSNFTQAYMSRTILTDVDLRPAEGLDTIEHRGPSTIGIDTLYKSHGKIPEAFLRGCGVPDPMIEYARALVTATQPIQYYSVFISYSSADEDVAKRLYVDLQAAGVRCWFAPEDLKIGDSIFEGIDQAIRLHEKLLIILSEASMASRWVQREVRAAQAREVRDGQQVLFPVRIDEAVRESGEGWAAELWTQRHIGDFCHWKEHDHYQTAFTRLLRDLRAGDATET